MTRIVVCLMHVAMLLVSAVSALAQPAPATTAASQADKPAPAAEDQHARQLKVSGGAWTGDFDKMLERRRIRVAIPYSRSLYFVDKGRERGLNAELVRDVERWLNAKYAKQLGKRPLTLYIVATTRDELLTDVRDGRADIAVGNLTVTEERLKLVDFVAPTTSSSMSRSLSPDRRRRRLRRWTIWRARPSTCERPRAITRASRR